jgi:uncharacterized membrane protein (UPF0127 family)
VFRYAIIIATLALLGAVASAQDFRGLELSVGIHRIEAEVVNTEQGRMIGLMRRQYLPPQRGMLFVFDADAYHCMWMKNTLIPLAVAFLDDQGKIINVEEMQPQTENNHCAAKPARFALEMNAGWFRQRGIGPGAAISGIERAPAPQ